MKTLEDLPSVMEYHPLTGHFIWRVDIRSGRNNALLKASAGERAGFHGSYGYRYVSIGGKRVAEHRAAWFFMTGAWPRHDIDHINGVRDDNVWANLRHATRSQNMQNLKSAHRDSETGFLGVERKRGKYAARIAVNGTRYNLGVFDTPLEAHNAYLAAKRELHEGCTL